MKRATLLLAAGVVVATALAGCKRKDDDDDGGSSVVPSSGPPPIALLPDDDDEGPPGLRRRGGLPRFPGAAEGPPTSLQGLLDGLPEISRPRPGPDWLIERNEAREWLIEHAEGKLLELRLRVTGITLSDAGERGLYNVDLLVAPPSGGNPVYLSQGVPVGQVVLGNDTWRAQVTAPAWNEVDAPTARKLRALKGKEVVLRGRVEAAAFLETGDSLLFSVKLEELPLPDSDAPELGPEPRQVP